MSLLALKQTRGNPSSIPTLERLQQGIENKADLLAFKAAHPFNEKAANLWQLVKFHSISGMDPEKILTLIHVEEVGK